MKMPRIKKSVLVILIFLVIIFLGIDYVYSKKDRKSNYDFIIVKKGELIQEVSVTGRVKSSESINLAFEKSGKVASINVKVGERVNSGQLLASLDNADTSAQLAQAEAGVENAKAILLQYQAALEVEEVKLEELKRGVRPEEIQIAKTNVVSAEQALTDAQISLENVIKIAERELIKAEQQVKDAKENLTNVKERTEEDLAGLYGEVINIFNEAYIKADDAIRNKIDEMLSDPITNPQLTFSIKDSQIKSDTEWGRKVVESELKKFEAELDTLIASDYSNLDIALNNAENYLSIAKDFLRVLNEAVNSAANLSQDTISTYQTNINNSRINVDTAISNIRSQKQKIILQKVINQNNIATAEANLGSAKNSLALVKTTNQSNIAITETKVNSSQNTLIKAQDELAFKQAGATQEQIASQEAQIRQVEANLFSQQAQVKQAQANVKNYQAQLAKTIVRSPIDGIITNQEVKVGEIVSVNSAVISIISEKEFQIETNVPEADIAKIKLGDISKVTLDAYGDEIVFEAKIAAVNPAATMVEGVATYKVTLQFTKDDERIKSGMTANIDILTARLENVIAVPGRTIISKNGRKVAQILKDDMSITEIEVETGVHGSDGQVEITKGIKEGERVVTFIEEE